MQTMKFKRDGKELLARVVEPGMYATSNMICLCKEVEGAPVVEIFDTDHSTYVDLNGKRLGHLIQTMPLDDCIAQMEAGKKGVSLSDIVPQWSLSASQAKRLLGLLREVQTKYENDAQPNMRM